MFVESFTLRKRCDMERDKILDFLKRMSDGMTVMFGKDCEVVIHDMKKEEASIVYIANKHVTQRKVGDKLDFLGTKELDTLHKGIDLVNRKGLSKVGHSIKSSTFHIEGDHYHFALGINYDYTNMEVVHNVVSEMIQVGEPVAGERLEKDENLEGQLEAFFAEAVDYVGKPIPFMRKQDRVKVIKYLYDKGTFSIHKSIPIIAEKMCVSRYTIYNYIKEIKE